MWCRHCQQDVPAVASNTRSRLVCSRCETPIERDPAQSGDELESSPDSGLDATQTLAASEARLRKLGRPLRAATMREEAEPFARLRIDRPLGAAAPRISTTTHRRERPQSASWVLSLILSGGISGLLVGGGILLCSAAYEAPVLWRIGMAATLASEGVLIVGLVWMAVRLWNSSRWVNRNLDGLHDRLDRLEDTSNAVWNDPHWQSTEAFDGYRSLTGSWAAEAKPR